VNRTMTYHEVKLSQRIIGLRVTAWKATKNSLKRIRSGDPETLCSLFDKGHIIYNTKGAEWMMSPQGIQQLKLQIGEFTF
jgi:hypothetical protein